MEHVSKDFQASRLLGDDDGATERAAALRVQQRGGRGARVAAPVSAKKRKSIPNRHVSFECVTSSQKSTIQKRTLAHW